MTPTTKAEHGGHDEPITCDEVVTRGLLDAELWERVMAAALEVFHRGSVLGREAGLILADTKYEFGLAIRRFADADRRGAHARLVAVVGRRHLRRPARRRRGAGEPRQGGRPAGVRRDRLPRRRPGAALADDVWTATSARYIDAFERLTGAPFVPGSYPVAERIVANLTEAGIL